MNVVATADLKQNTDLALLNDQPWGLFDLDIYPAGYIKDASIQGKVIVFGSGKLISVGATDIETSIQNLVHAKKLLISAKLIRDVMLEPQIRNIVATLDMGKQILLERVSSTLESTMYEPEQFPGVIWRPRDQSVSILLFASGKVVIAGLRSLRQYAVIQEYVRAKLSRFMLDS